MTPDFSTVAGDETPLYRYTVAEPDGTPVDVTGKTITIRMHVDDDPTAVAIEATGAVVDGLNGVVDVPVAGPAGMYNGEIVVGPPTNDRTFPPDRPLRIHIRSRV